MQQPGLASRIAEVMFHLLGRLTMLQWRPRLFVLIAVLALLSIAVVGGWGDVLNLYW
jgi:nitrate reductase NapE component